MSRGHTIVAATVVLASKSLCSHLGCASGRPTSCGGLGTEQGPGHPLAGATVGPAGMWGVPGAGARTRSWDLGQQLRLRTQVGCCFRGKTSALLLRMCFHICTFAQMGMKYFYPRFLRVFLMGVLNIYLCVFNLPGEDRVFQVGSQYHLIVYLPSYCRE